MGSKVSKNFILRYRYIFSGIYLPNSALPMHKYGYKESSFI